MDSINKNQQEENHENLNGQDALKRIKKLVKKVETCFFCSSAIGEESNGVRPMSVQKVDKQGVLWFLSAKDSHKNKEIEANPLVKLYFQGSSYSDFLYINGEASISEDKNKIKELWEPVLKTWFTEGEKDTRISVIKVIPTDGYYWKTKHGQVVAGIKMIIGAAIGKTLDDSIEGSLKVKKSPVSRTGKTVVSTKKKIAATAKKK